MSTVYSSNLDLRTVETSYDIERVNEAKKSGHICLIRKRAPNPKLRFSRLILQNRETGEFAEVPSREFYMQYTRHMVYSEDQWATIQEVKGYARLSKTDRNWGAYILPPDAKVGEEFVISELIEDLLATEFWHSKTAAESAIATWDGKDLVIDHSSYEMHLIG